MARCTRGQVFMTTNKVLTDKEVAEGWVLTCVGYPVSEEVTIEWP
jgi:ring-1,2-phenylacetyl-CoA epoxidase subunit PaaE